MFTYNRRDFIRTSGNILGAAALSGLTFGCRKKDGPLPTKWKGFKYAMCNESMAELSWAEQCQIIGDAGYKGVEIATFSLVKQGVREITPDRRKEMVSTMKNAGIECVGLHWLLAPPPKGLHFTTPDAAVRRKTLDYFNELIDFCGDLGGPYMIFGSPKQRNSEGISVKEATKYFVDSLAKVADHAGERHVKILIEPLGKKVTDVANTMAESLDVARQVNHPAVQIMFDFHNTTDETESFDVLIKKYFDNIHHVHVQEMDGKHLGTGTAVNDYVKAFQTLRDLQFDKWVSLEVFDFKPGGKKIAEESMRVLKQIESKLVT
ncbi:MAG: sugar phosphate isomerase/epimerase [Sedimentisphaerales bacterium]|nr:sugar phosphate isomerase/epimerase [Sedimentisphaerales bacterium]